MPARALVVLALVAAPALAGPPAGPGTSQAPERDLTGAEQRLLDGAYLYLVSPGYCDPALPADRLRAWIAGLLRRHAIPPGAASAYLADQEARLGLIAGTAFGGRRGTDLCRSILESAGAVPGRGGIRPKD